MRCDWPLGSEQHWCGSLPRRATQNYRSFNICKAVELKVWSPSCQSPVAKLSLSGQQTIRARSSSCRGLVIKLSRSSCWFTSSSMSSCQAVKVVRVKPSRLSESSRQGCPSQAVKVVRVKPSRLSESSRQGCQSQAVKVVRVKPSRSWSKVPSSSVMTMDR